jgi:hypothetical protein
MLAADLFAFSSFASQLAAESELWAVNMSQTEDPVVPLADRQRQRRPSVCFVDAHDRRLLLA